MNHKFHAAFDQIKAEQALKQNTLAYIAAYGSKAKKRKQALSKYYAVAACILALFITGAYSYNSYFTPNAYIDVDINPSIELTLNKYGKVIGLYAYNSDGENIVASLGLKYASYENALSGLMEMLAQEGYMAKGGLLSVTVQAGNGGDELLDNVRSFFNKEVSPAYEQEIFLVDQQTKAHAHDLDISPAKYLAILAMQQADPAMTLDECMNHSIGELRQLTQAHGAGHSPNTEEGSAGSRHRHGH